MLTEWSVSGFKSIRSASKIPLKNITVFAGANSSGKSSLLQSILLLKQTVQYGAPNRPLALNGPIIRLGTLEDVIFAGADVHELRISFCFSVPAIGTRAPWMEHHARSSYMLDSSTLQDIQANLAWIPAAGRMLPDRPGARLQSDLASGTFTVTKSAENSDVSQFHATYKKTGAGSEKYDVKLDDLSKAEVFRSRADASLQGLYISHFLPEYVHMRFNATKQRAHEMSEAIFSPRGLVRPTTTLRERIPVAVLITLNEWLAEQGLRPFSTSEPVTVAEVSERLQPYSRRPRSHRLAQGDADLLGPTTDLRALQETVETALLESIDGGDKWKNDLEIPRTIAQGAGFLTSFLKTGVRYLGPLRDEPRPVYPLEALENTTDVGYRGEHTAAVLELNGRSFTQYIPSQSFKDGVPSFKEHGTQLLKAVIDWLGYMGVADNVIAQEEGVFGNRLQVTTPGLDKFHDLTNVGVGVSQVLPIVVSCLLAPKSSLLIFEQPELHLHPRVQARLADFFLAVAMSGRQCILETHSEYLIERFRKRIAETDREEVENILGIYFAEREAGETHFRPVEVTRFGAIKNWPKDFFDQSQVETSEILEAASRKRARDRGKS